MDSSHRCFLGLLFMCAAASPLNGGQVWYVDRDADAVWHNGTTWCRAFFYLQDAIAVAVPGDEIRVANGDYRPDRGVGYAAGDRTATFSLKNGVVLLGGYAGCGAGNPDARDFTVHETILSGDLAENDQTGFINRGDNSFHVVTYSDPGASGVVLDGFTIRGGNADGTGPANLTTNQGSGIHIRQGTTKCIPGGPTIRNCTIRDNWAAHHGAINDHGFATVIENCTFLDNFAKEEGAGLLIHSGSAQVTGCSFINNVTDKQGGGVWVGHDLDPSCTASASPAFTACTFTGNRANFLGGEVTDGGGAIFNQGEHLTLDGCVFSENIGFGNGGAVYTKDGAGATVTNCTFTGNRAEKPVLTQSYGNGGAITHKSTGFLSVRSSSFTGNYATSAGALHVNGPAELLDCTFEGNAAGYAGALRNWKDLTLTRCTFTGNTANGAAGAQFEGTGNVVMTNVAFLRNVANGAIGGAFNVLGSSLGSSNLTATNCLIAENEGQSAGGIIYATGQMALQNCSIVGNQVRSSGQHGAISVLGPVTIANSILWGNRDRTGQTLEIDQITVDGGDLNIDNSCVQGWSGTFAGSGNSGLDPLLVQPVNGDYRLSEASPCIDAAASASMPPDLADLDGDGDLTEPVPLDLDGLNRIAYDGLDMGAYEFGLCPAGYFSTTAVQPCEPCAPGTFQVHAGATTCSPCAPGTYQQIPGSTACLPCGPGTFQAEDGGASCVACSPGTYRFDGGGSACDPCPPGSVTAAAGQTTCATCAAGTYQPQSGQTACLLCACDDGNGCTADTCDAADGACGHLATCIVPATSAWGLAVLAILAAICGTLLVAQRQTFRIGA